jgi:hypothetical protein
MSCLWKCSHSNVNSYKENAEKLARLLCQCPRWWSDSHMAAFAPSFYHQKRFDEQIRATYIFIVSKFISHFHTHFYMMWLVKQMYQFYFKIQRNIKITSEDLPIIPYWLAPDSSNIIYEFINCSCSIRKVKLFVQRARWWQESRQPAKHACAVHSIVVCEGATKNVLLQLNFGLVYRIWQVNICLKLRLAKLLHWKFISIQDNACIFFLGRTRSSLSVRSLYERCKVQLSFTFFFG